MTTTDRRHFLTTAAAVAAVTPFAGAFGAGREDILNLALVGCGGRGKGSIGDTMAVNEGVRLVAISDVNQGKVQAAKVQVLRPRAPQRRPAQRALPQGSRAIKEQEESSREACQELQSTLR